ncbi:MAG: ribonuclease D [Rhodospirillales bacterium]|nr:ribonuclease D [Rhodospirillales bacterium]
MSVEVHVGDLPADVRFGDSVAIDTETTGLNPHRDRLCLVQLFDGDKRCHLVHFPPHGRCSDAAYDAPNLVRLLSDPDVTKIFHFARFDVGMLQRWLGVACAPVYCTKIASRLVRTYTDRHGLKDLCRELTGVELQKEQQSSDWGGATLTPEQICYAANDVLWLHRLRERLDAMLEREGRADLAAACFAFLGHRAQLDLAGWAEVDIFSH